jgi:hypothetical protein
MARVRNTDSGIESVEATDGVEAVVPEEGTPVVEVTEAPVENAEAPAADETAAPEAATEADAPVDITDFEAAVETAVSGADASTGQLVPEQLTAVQTEYAKLDTKGKPAARNHIKVSLKKSVKGNQLERAKSLYDIQDSLSSATKAKAPRETKKVDPTESYVENKTTLLLAQGLVLKPEGTAEDADARATAQYNDTFAIAQGYLNWITAADKDARGDEPEVPAFVKSAVKLAIGKKVKASSGGNATSSGPSYDGPKRAVAKHIAEAFENEPVGKFLKIAEIVKFKSNEYGDDKPSAGAVTGALKSAKFAIPGLKPDNQGGFGAVKTA